MQLKYYEPPGMAVKLNTFELVTSNEAGNGLTSESTGFYNGCSVEIFGEYGMIDIDTEGLESDIQKAIDEVIYKHIKKENND